jgi:hypothetical protein
MVFNLTHSQLILRYKENGGRIKPYTIVIMQAVMYALEALVLAGKGLNAFSVLFTASKNCHFPPENLPIYW